MNLFIRTTIAPYRIDLYNALHTRLNMRMCFYAREATDQRFSPEWLESRCNFVPTYLKGFYAGAANRKVCSGLWKMVREEKPELVIVPEFQPVLYQLLLIRFFRRRKFRIVSMCDDSIDMIESSNDFSLIHRFLRKWAPRLVDDLIVVSPDVQKWYQSHFGKGIWLPILMDEVRARKETGRLLPMSASLQEEHHLKGKKVVLFVGRLVEIKNVDLLIDVCSALQEDAALVIVGDGPEAENLRKKAQGNERILFTGRLEGDALYAWYHLADVTALLSRQEAFGAVINEALVSGSRVLVSEKAGSACLVTPENGAVVPIGDKAVILSALKTQLALSQSFDGRSMRPCLMPFTFKERVEVLEKELLKKTPQR